MNYTKFSLSLLTASILNATLIAPTVAQEALAQAEQDNVEIISVKGIRSSITDALSVKQNSDVIADAISSEDIGKLPDENVAETLQRITGIQIQRRNGEGSRVSVRGLVQNRIEIDGVSLVNPIGRSYSGFDETVFPVLQFVPSELLSGIEVYKSYSADQIAGSLGGTVNLTLLKPLSIGDRFSGAVQASYDDKTEDTDPRLSVTLSKELIEGELGVLFSLTQARRSVGEELFFTRTGWSGSEFFSNGDFRLQTLEEDRDRTGAVFNVQWRPTSDTEIYLNTFYAAFDIERERSWFSSGGSGGTNPDDYLTPPTILPSGTIIAGEFVSQLQGNGEALNNDSETQSIVAGFEHTIEDLLIKGLVSFGDAEQVDDQSFARVRQNDVSFAKDFRGDVPSLSVIDQTDPNNPSTYDSGSGLIGFSNDITYESEETTAELEFEYFLSGDFITSVEAGVRWADQESSRTQFRAGNPSGGGVWIVATPGGLEGNIDSSLYQSVSLSNVFGGAGSNVTNFLAANPRGLGGTSNLLSYVQQNATADGAGVFFSQPDGTYSTQEEITSLYGLVNFETEIADKLVTGSFGGRWVDTQQTSEFFVIDESGPTAQSLERDYDNFLPSANVKVQLDDDLFVRGAYSKVISRPDTFALAGGVSLDQLAGTASGGNPLLDVAEADAFDVSVEWYINDFSAFTVGLFTKDVSGFLAPQTERRQIPGSLNNDPGSPDFGTEFFLVSSVAAGGESSIDGIELAYQTVLDSGFGAQINYTFVDSDGLDSENGETTQLEGLSENSYNLVLFYEQDNYSARFAYNWRDEYLVSRNFNGSPLFEEARGQLDFSASYDINENWRVTFDAINLNDERVDQYSELVERKFRIEDTGRRFFLGVRATY